MKPKCAQELITSRQQSCFFQDNKLIIQKKRVVLSRWDCWGRCSHTLPLNGKRSFFSCNKASKLSPTFTQSASSPHSGFSPNFSSWTDAGRTALMRAAGTVDQLFWPSAEAHQSIWCKPSAYCTQEGLHFLTANVCVGMQPHLYIKHVNTACLQSFRRHILTAGGGD